METGVLVPFVAVNFDKCLCIKCPVQLRSPCVKGKFVNLKDSLNKNPLEKEDIPGVYCSSGTATCTDIKSTEECVCGKCVIFPEYKLYDHPPMGHYCVNGDVR
jgi:hypothetical protein